MPVLQKVPFKFGYQCSECYMQIDDNELSNTPSPLDNVHLKATKIKQDINTCSSIISNPP